MTTDNTAPPLWADHLQILAERAIPPEYAAKVGLESIDLRKVKAHVEKYKVKSPYPHLPLHQTTGILIPYPWMHDDIPRFRVRSDKTEVTIPGPIEGAEDHGAHTITIPRYICQGKPVSVAPYITPEARAVAGDTNIPIAFLEAPFKACSYAANIGPAIGMGGVLAGGHDVDELHEHQELLAHSELRTIDWRGRLAPIVYDASMTTNPMVALGAAYLSFAVAREGADTKLVYVPHFHLQDSDPIGRGIFHKKTDQGPDDYIYRNGAEALRKLVTEAVPADPVARVRIVRDLHSSKADRAAAIAVLLRDLPFRAMLYAGGHITVSEVVALTKPEFGARAIQQAAAEFGHSLARHADRENEHEDKRVVVYVSTDEKKVNDEVVAALTTDPSIYQRDSLLVTITRAPEPPPSSKFKRREGTPTITPIPMMGLRERITELVRLMQRGSEEDKQTHPPDWMAAQIHVRKVWEGIRPLTGIIEAPTMRPDGSILQTPGYDYATGLVYLPTIEFPPVTENPTREEAEEALAKLKYVLTNYEFAKPMHEAAAIAALMTPTVRPSVDGFVPAIAIDANKRGIGKTKQVDLASIIATGRKAARLAFTRDDGEIKKQLTSIVLAGDPIILVDNVPGQFGAPVWDEFLTAARWQDRILGTMSMVNRAIMVTVYITGNNIEPEGDIARRTLHVRLQTDLERPDTRPASTFKERDLEGYVLEHRAELVVAILTILRAYIVAENREVEGAVWGSFEAWADRIAKPLIWLGMADPCETRKDFEATPSAAGTRAAAFLGAWERVHGNTPVTVSDVLRNIATEKTKDIDKADAHVLMLADAIQAVVPAKAGEYPSVYAVGKKLGNLKDSVHSGLRMVADGERDGTTLWKVERVLTTQNNGRCSPEDDEAAAAFAAEAAKLLENV